MNVSVVIATHNRREQLRRCLLAVQQQALPPHELIVVDDASTDETAEMVRRDFPEATLLVQEANQGPAAARNRGIAVASGEVVAFTDDDCVPPPSWLALLVKGFAEHPGVFGVSGYQEAGDELLATNFVAQADHFMRLESSGPGADRAQQGGAALPGFGTNNAAYLREALQAVNGFDESFLVASGEDTDLKIRIATLGQQRPATLPAGPLLYIPLKVRHDREYTVRAQWRLGFKRGMGAYHFERKHAKAPGFLRIGLRFGIRTLRFLRDLLRYSPPVAVVIYMTRFADCCGQMQMAVRALRGAD